MLYVLIGAAVLVLLIVLEGWRQSRIYGPPTGTGSSAMGSAMLELQKTLEPEKKVEILMVDEDEEQAADSGEPPQGSADS